MSPPHAARAGLAAGVALAGVDLAQVALRHPGTLSPTAALVLIVLWIAGAAAVVAVVARAGRRWYAAGSAAAAVGGLVLGLLGAELALQLAPRRTLAWALAGAVATLPLTWIACRVARLRRPRLAAAVVVVALGVAALGATRGTGSPRRGAHPAANGPARPNVLLIVIDTLRADHLGAYGYARATSPVIDGLARDGTLFLRAFAQATTTKPSTASLLTGTFPSTHGTTMQGARLGDDAVLLAERLRPLGYETAMLSANAWVTPGFGFDQGSDHFYGVTDEHLSRFSLLMTSLRRVNYLVADDATVYAGVKRVVERLVHGTLSTTRRDELVLAEARRWLARPRQAPFLLYVHLMSPHHPYDPPPPFDHVFPRPPGARPTTMHPAKGYRFGSRGEPLAAPELADMVARYDGDVLFADGIVGELLEAVWRHADLGRTVVVLTSDHGEEFYDHENWGHGQSLFNELLHVPLLLRYPPRVAAGARVAAPVMSVDVVPTILDLVGVPPAALPGRSLAGTPRGTGEAYAEMRYSFQEGQALVDGADKLIETRAGDRQGSALYDLARDVGERHDRLAAGAEAPEARSVAERLRARAAALRARAEAMRLHPAPATPTAAELEQLRALGYTFP